MNNTTVKFNKFNVTNGTDKARVFYSLDGHVSGRKVVTLYAKGYAQGLGKMFAGEVKNASDSTTDYFEKDTVRLFEDHPLYGVARARVEFFKASK